MSGSDRLLETTHISVIFVVRGTPGLFLVAPDGHIAYKRISGTEPERARLAIIETMSEPGIAMH